MASLWQKKSGVWCVTFRQNGKQRVRSLRTKDKRTALKLKRAGETTLDEGGAVVLEVSDRPKPPIKNPTVEEFWGRFYHWTVTNRAPSTVKEYAIWFHQLIRFTGAERMRDVTREDAEAFKAALAEQGMRKPAGSGLQHGSINNSLKTLQSIWNHGAKLGLYTGENPFIGVERFSLPRNFDRDYLDKVQIDKLLPKC